MSAVQKFKKMFLSLQLSAIFCSLHQVIHSIHSPSWLIITLSLCP